MTVIVGCSGWSFDDWVGRFYPIELAKKKGEWFSYYSQYFHTVEINSTFYRPPNEFMVKAWANKAKDIDFEYSVKMPQLVTHEALVKGETQKAVEMARSFEKVCVDPLADAGKMGCTLLQLSPYVQNEGKALDNLRAVLDALEGKHDYAVEFRHRSWLDESKHELAPDVIEMLKERNVANVIVDGPGLPITRTDTADHGYFRLHGRNYDIWYREEKEDDLRLNRYDYLYSKEQLENWVPRIKETERKAKVRVYFNNHAYSKSAKNALDLMDLLGLEHKPKDIKITAQYKLDTG